MKNYNDFDVMAKGGSFLQTPQFKTMYEARRHGNELLPIMNYCIRQEDAFSALVCHWHNEMELFRVMQGVVTVQCGDVFFEAKAGDIIFFNSGELHSATPADSSRDLYFQAIVFSPDFLAAAVNDIIRMKYVSPVMSGELQVPHLIRQGTPLFDRISALFDRTYELLELRPPFFEFAARADMLLAFGALVEEGEVVSLGARQGAAAGSIRKVISYVHEHYRQPFTIEQMAALAGMSEGHFCRIFKQYTTKTPVHFVNSVRLSHAADRLQNTNQRVIDIALDCGFNSVSYFIEVFRENFNTTPTRFRKGDASSSEETERN